MKECQNCGMPMVKEKDFGNGDPKNFLCCHCFQDKSVGASKEENVRKKTNGDLPSLCDFDNVDVGETGKN